MYTISGTTISMINKDTADIVVSIENYIFQNGDKIYFTVKNNINDTSYLFQKVVTSFPTNTSALIELSTTDTDLEPNRYTYDIQLSRANGKVDTIVGPATFIINKGVTD